MTAAVGQRYPRTERGIRARRAEVERLARQGLSDGEIASKVGVSWRTVLRDRTVASIPSTWKPVRTLRPHGTDSRYNAGCSCDACRAAHAAAHTEWNHASGRIQRYYRNCPDCGARCFVDTPDTPVDCVCHVVPELRAFAPAAEPDGGCAVDDCDEPPYCRGMCRGHYDRLRIAWARARRAVARKAGAA